MTSIEEIREALNRLLYERSMRMVDPDGYVNAVKILREAIDELEHLHAIVNSPRGDGKP